MLRDNYSSWRCAGHEISLVRPRIMGVLNVTPDSFSDGGDNLDVDTAIAHGMRMLDDGADIIDVGGESTRPGHEPVSVEDELERVAPVVEALCNQGAIVSVDTRTPEVAQTCLELGASIVNDVEGFSKQEMVDIVSEWDCGVVAMHWNKRTGRGTRKSVRLDTSLPARRTVPSARRFTLPEEMPVMREIMGFLGDQARQLMRAGVSHDRICVDPGAGFQKTTDQDIIIQRNTRKLVSMGYHVMCAVSRKRFVGAVTATSNPLERDAATMGICLSAINNGARVLRVHDVPAAFGALTAYWAASCADQRQGFVALGSNVGDRMQNLAEAARRIDKIPLTCVTNVSNAYETEPAYGIATPVANAVAEIRTELHPLVLLDYLLRVEDQLGRTREASSLGHGPRTIDCDLCWIEGERHQGARLTLPHPGLGEREFILVPMEDLMPDPMRFFGHAGVVIQPVDQRVGRIMSDLGPVDWQRTN